jgi:hypothetical protein
MDVRDNGFRWLPKAIHRLLQLCPKISLFFFFFFSLFFFFFAGGLLPVFINLAVHFHLGAGDFYFCRGKIGWGPGEKFFAKCFCIGPGSRFSLAAKIFLRSTQLLFIGS